MAMDCPVGWVVCFFFFTQKTAYEMRISDWSSDVCSSDLFVRAYGVADRSTGAPVTPHTLFRWASVSKTATGVLAAAMAKDGTIDLDRPVAAWRTSLHLPGGAEARVTLGDLLSQRTGLTKNAYDDRLEAGQSPALLRASLAAAPPQSEPARKRTRLNSST